MRMLTGRCPAASGYTVQVCDATTVAGYYHCRPNYFYSGSKPSINVNLAASLSLPPGR